MNKTLLIIYSIWTIIIIIIIIIQSSHIHPVFIIIFMLIYNIILCINIIIIKTNPLYPIIFFIIIIRGLLIIFLYFSRLVSNEKTLNLIYKSIAITITINVLFLTPSIYKNNLLIPIINSNTHINIINPNHIPILSSTSLIYFSPFINITIVCIIFLLICLISVIKTCVPKIKTLRKIN